MLGKAPHQGGVRLIAVDRPGIGQSQAHGDWTFLSFAEDVRQLADDLGIDKFGMLGAIRQSRRVARWQRTC
jgi:pimeloyl-ACP methyl ester carboxylesterase